MLTYLRRHRRLVEGATCEYWTLVESHRTTSGPRQYTVAALGKLPGLEVQVHAGWEAIDDLLEGRAPAKQLELTGENPPAPPRWCQVDVRGVRVERVREFGEVYLALSLWRRLGLHKLLAELIPSGREEVPWERIACLLAIARFCAQPSELGVAQRWCARTALEDLLGVSWEKIDDDRLYHGLDALHEHKEQLTQHLLQRYESWFGVGFEFLLYDVTSTFFKGQALGNTKAACGYSRDHVDHGRSGGRHRHPRHRRPQRGHRLLPGVHAEKSIAALKKMTAPQAKVRRDGQVISVPASAIVIGDILAPEAGDLVAADARLLTAASLKSIESTLTGESEAVTKQPATLEQGDVPLGDRENMAFMGTSVAAGTGQAVGAGTVMAESEVLLVTVTSPGTLVPLGRTRESRPFTVAR